MVEITSPRQGVTKIVMESDVPIAVSSCDLTTAVTEDGPCCSTHLLEFSLLCVRVVCGVKLFLPVAEQGWFGWRF